MPRSRASSCVTMFLVGALACSAQVVWNPASGFSTTNGNPNGVWSYGWMDNGFVTFTPYASTLANQWYGWGGDFTPAVWLNTSATTSFGVPAGSLALHPGNGNQPSILRWTAPAGISGVVQITGQFGAGDIGTMQVGVLHNSSFLWNATDAGAFNLSANVSPGHTLSFAVYGGYGYGNTPLQLQITGVPEPSTLVLLAVGGILLVSHLRRLRRHP